MQTTQNIWRAGAVALFVGAGACQASLLAHFSFDSGIDSVAGIFTGIGTLKDDAAIDHTTHVLGGGALKLDGGQGAGETGLAAEMDGITYSNGAEMKPGTGNYTITAWINHLDRTTPVRQSIVDAGGNDLLFYMGNSSSTRLRLWVRAGGYTTTALGPWAPPPGNPGSWKHVAVVVDQAANEIRFYENGTFDQTTPVSDEVDNIDGWTFNIGYQLGFERGFNGWIDEVGVWNEALDATAILNVYNNGIVP